MTTNILLGYTMIILFLLSYKDLKWKERWMEKMGAILTVLIPPIIAWVILGVMLSDNTMTRK